MFKRAKESRKQKANLIAETFTENKSNFKAGSIELSTKEVLFFKLRQLEEFGGLPKPKQQFRIVTQNSINSFDFILAVLANEVIDELIVAFYRIGKKVTIELKELYEQKKIKHLHFLVNDGIPKLTPEAYNLLKSLEDKNWKVRLDNNHTKIILIKTTLGYYVIEGSGNLSINARIEQYVVDNNEQLYLFHKNWITAI